MTKSEARRERALARAAERDAYWAAIDAAKPPTCPRCDAYAFPGHDDACLAHSLKIWRDLSAGLGKVPRFAPDEIRAVLMAEQASASIRATDTSALDQFFAETFAACGEELIP